MNFKSEHIIDGMIYSHDIEKWVTIEEYYQEYNSPLNVKLKEYKVGGKLYGHYTKCGKLTNKYAI